MANLKFGSPGTTAREIDLSGAVNQAPTGIPAGVIGTSTRGPAFVPVTVGVINDFYAKFGRTDGKKFGPLAVTEWLRNAGALTYLRVLGVGDGRRRVQTGNTAGSVTTAGFVVGEQLPIKTSDGILGANPYANSNGILGRTYMLGCLMSESNGSGLFSSASLQKTSAAHPILRGVILAPSGVVLRLSSSAESSNAAPGTSDIASDTSGEGTMQGTVVLLENNVAKQDFVLFLNGHKGTNSSYPNVITASFDLTSPNYFANVLNKDPYSIQQAGHYLYAHWDIHPVTATVTGSGIVAAESGSAGSENQRPGVESSAFLLTGSVARNVGSATVPNYENFEDRFGHASTPWFTSQRFGGTRVNLFKIHALDDGSGISTSYKISIENIAPSTDPADRYGTFDVVVRDWNDRDTDVKPLEAWRGCDLNPSSDRYIAKVIGDANVYFDFDKSEASQKLSINGQFPLNSNLIRVEMSEGVNNATVDETAMPIGFRGHQHLVTSGSAPLSDVLSTQLVDATTMKRVITPPVPFRLNITAGTGAKKTVNPLLYWGTQFEHITTLATPNGSTLVNKSLASHAKYFPNFMTEVQNFVVGANEGEAETTANGVMDADIFNLGAFSLDNIQVTTGSNTLADVQEWDDAVYIRDGNIATNDATKTRRLSMDDFNQSNRSFLKFTTFLQGGFNGVNLFDRDEAELSNNAVTEDMNNSNRGTANGPNVRTYMKAIDLIKSTTEVDIQVLAIPGLRHPIISNAAIDAVEDRFDALYVMDVEQLDTNSDLVTADTQLPDVSKTVDRFANRSMDSSFAAAYFPDIIMEDPNTKTNVVAPPSVAVLGALALNDKVGHPWFAPAGFTRGALPTVQEARVGLSKENMDSLYDVDVNPLVAFPGNASSGTNPKGGVVVWGQKTLQASASALDRVNVRRLLIDIRRDVRAIARTMVFEPNRATTLARFSAAVTPRLQRVQSLSGLDKFKVIIDSSTTTDADVLNNTIRGVIMIQPTRTNEFISVDFVVTNDVANG